MTLVSVAFKKLRVFSLRNLGFRPIFYGTGSVQGFLHLGFRPIFIKKRFYFTICIGFIPVFFQWELYIFGMGLIYLWYGNYIQTDFFMVLVVYKGSYISVSDRFLLKKRFYFEICISFIAIYYRNRCQTGEKAIYEYRVGYKMVISQFSPIC